MKIKLLSMTPFPLCPIIFAIRTCYESYKHSDSILKVSDKKYVCGPSEEIVKLRPKIEYKITDLEKDPNLVPIHFSEFILGENDRSRLESCIKSGHLSVLEHAHLSFYISEVSIAFSHQLVRHRLFSYSQRSQRYVNESQFDYIIPESIENSKYIDNYRNVMENIKCLYKSMTEDKEIKKEDARMILPNAVHTDLVASGNFRTFFEYLPKRAFNKHAQGEHRELALMIYDILNKMVPVIFNDENFGLEKK